MVLSYNWLKSHIKTELSIEKITSILTDIGLEVEGIHLIEKTKGNLENIYVGEVLECNLHPNADKLKLTTIDVGQTKPLQIVCGASNIKKGQKVAVATQGAFVLDKTGKPFQIKNATIRDIQSEGMICSETELGIGNNSSGILELDTETKVGTKIAQLYPQENDFQIEVGLTPNRADAMSHYGVARDLYAYLKLHKFDASFEKISISEFDSIIEKELQPSPIKIDIKENLYCSRYVGLYIENITIKKSPEWLKNQLKTIGIEPKNNVVDITNFVLHNIGQPIHAFDADKIGRNLTVKPSENISFVSLDKVERKLTKDSLIIFDEKRAIALAGIIGGLESSVTEKTKNIFLESAYFDSVAIRKSAKYQGISTDASFRFERGVDPNLTKIAIKQAAILLHKYADAKINYKIVEQKQADYKDFDVILRYQKIDQILGQKIEKEKIKQILTLLDIKIISEKNETLNLAVPPYRVDIKREIDVIEEIVRIYGYNEIQSPKKISTSIVPNPNHTKEKAEKLTANGLVNLGFYEAMNNSLTKENTSKILGQSIEKNISIVNPLSGDLSFMRQSLLGGLLENISFNINRQQKNCKLFEFGQIYHLDSKGIRQEQKKLGIILSGNKSEENWISTPSKVSFFTIKGIVIQLLKRLNIQTSEMPHHSTFLLEGISFNDNKNEVLGIVGLLSPSITQQYSIQQEVFYAELDWEKICSINSEPTKYTALPKFPRVRRDLALLVDKNLKYSELEKLAHETEKEILTEVNLFDVYEGKNLPENKKSYALSFYLQNKEKTLKDTEIELVMNKILDNFREKLQAELR